MAPSLSWIDSSELGDLFRGLESETPRSEGALEEIARRLTTYPPEAATTKVSRSHDRRPDSPHEQSPAASAARRTPAPRPSAQRAAPHRQAVPAAPQAPRRRAVSAAPPPVHAREYRRSAAPVDANPAAPADSRTARALEASSRPSGQATGSRADAGATHSANRTSPNLSDPNRGSLTRPQAAVQSPTEAARPSATSRAESRDNGPDTNARETVSSPDRGSTTSTAAFQPSPAAALDQRIDQYLDWVLTAHPISGVAIVDTHGLVVAQRQLDADSAMLAIAVEFMLAHLRNLFAWVPTVDNVTVRPGCSSGDGAPPDTIDSSTVQAGPKRDISGRLALRYGTRHLGAAWTPTSHGRLYAVFLAGSVLALDMLPLIEQGLSTLFAD